METPRRTRRALVALVLASAILMAPLPGLHLAGAAILTPGSITTVVGGMGTGTALDTGIGPGGMTLKGSTLYVADSVNGVVRAIDLTTGNQQVVAGSNSFPSVGRESGDGGPATAASLDEPRGLALDGAGNLYIAEWNGHRVRKVDPAGVISTVAGVGVAGFSGDGGPATAAGLYAPWGLAVDHAGNLFIAEWGNRRVRQVDTSGVIRTIAGNGHSYDTAIGDVATTRGLRPTGVALDPGDNLVIGDALNQRVYKLSGQTLSVIAAVPTSVLAGIATDAGGKVYVSEAGSNKVVVIDSAGATSVFAGTGSDDIYGPLGDGGPATAAGLAGPYAITVDGSGVVYIADTGHARVRRVDAGGTITTIAGNGVESFSGDGVAATSAELSHPEDIDVDATGNLVFADMYNRVIRSVSPSGVIHTIAGTGSTRIFAGGGDGGPATAADVGAFGIGTDHSGNVYLADGVASRIRKVAPDGVITTVAGNGALRFSGDGGPATSASLANPYDVAVGADGSLYIADTQNNRIRKVTTAGIITTIAGTGDKGSAGDGGAAVAAQLNFPRHLALDSVGNIYVGDEGNARIRVIDTTGRIFTVASGFQAGGLAIDATGNIYASDVTANKVYRFDRHGTKAVVAGSGAPGFTGDGGPALAARLSAPLGLAVAGDTLYVGDGNNKRIRQVELVPSRALGWGLNHVGQTGDSSTVSATVPTAAAGSLSDVRNVSAGAYHSLAAGDDGSAWAWGWNGLGQLGTASTIDAHLPTRIAGLDGVVSVSAGWFHSLAVTADGSVWAWGWNGVGQLGLGDTADRHRPTRVPGLSGIVAVSAGEYHSLARAADGSVWAWGWNGLGQLGTGGSRDSHVPARVPGLSSIVGLSAGALHSLAVRSDGTAWSWGWNGLGELGTGTTVNSSSPSMVPGLTGVATVSAGGYHSLALKDDGSVWAWGWNAVGQLGAGHTSDSHTPTPTAGLGSGVTAVSAGGAHSVALMDDGTLRAWGWNALGQLGTGGLTDRDSPSPVSGIVNARTVSAGYLHSLATS